MARAGFDVWFVIAENKPAQIKRVDFWGNKRYPTSVLRKLLFSQPPTIQASVQGRGFYHPSFVANDLYVLRNFYYDRGYLQSRISGPKVHVDRRRKTAILVYKIVEGPVFRFGRINIEGDYLIPLAKLKKKLTFRTGDVFNRSQLYRNQVMLKRMYQDAGYYYTRIQVVPKVTGDRKVHLQIYLVKGPSVYVERIELVGNTHTVDFVVRRRIFLKEGGLFSATKLLRSRLFLLGSGFFERTDARQGIKTVIRRGSADNKIIIRFMLKEKKGLLPFTRFIPNFGFSFLPLDGAVFTLQLAQNNFLGLGQTLRLGGVWAPFSGRLWNIFFNLYDPHIFDTDFAFFVSGSVYHRDNSSPVNAGFLNDSLRGSIGFSHPLGLPRLRLSVNYRISRVRLSATGRQELQVPIANYYSTRTSGSLFLQLRWDTRNRSVNPTKGFTLYGSYEHAAPYFGGDYSLHRLEAGGRLFVPLFWKVVLKFAATTGWSFSQDADGVLPFERFPLDGSFFLVRGYLPFSIGPQRNIPSRSEPDFTRGRLNWGGTKKFVFNTELDIPLVISWLKLPQIAFSFVVFFDAGNVFDDYEFMFQDTRNQGLPLGLFMNLGFGFRWTLPNVGVMRFEWGIPLSPRAGDPAILFNFQVGEAF